MEGSINNFLQSIDGWAVEGVDLEEKIVILHT